ncbi:hypothetical protein PROFUN_10351 [Planoprotostelium fungivorum]|uniref:Uncharacterized protein n=1 Tax=Planoprotostelium fungivorum TaxID=1890364 RepID=A0A2P6NDV0_9EUKA|nr:hypothetical protein PROFUN_10351 [Planoprotostelium fungivorum]
MKYSCGNLGKVESQSEEDKDEPMSLFSQIDSSFVLYRFSVITWDVSKRHSNSCDRSHAQYAAAWRAYNAFSRHCHMCNFNKGMLHHSFSIAPAQSTKECALSVTCRQTSTASSHGNKQEIELCFCTCLQHNEAATVKSSNKMSDRFPPIRGSSKDTVGTSAATCGSIAHHAETVTTHTTPVVDVVHAAQVPNMAPSAVAQPPVILTELDLLTIRQVGNLYAASRGTELLSKQTRLLRRKVKQGHDHFQ